MSQRYAVRIQEDEVLGKGVYELLDLQTGSRARIAPTHGNNLYSLIVPIRGKEMEALLGWAPPPGSGSPSPRPLGSPILFPYPGRVRGGRFSFEGRAYQLELNLGENAIHGFVSGLGWIVEKSEAASEGARLVASVASADHPEIASHYPFPFRLTVGYTLSGGTVALDAEVANVGPTAMPMGFGIHPWFRLPLAEDGSRASCELRVPAGRAWETEPSVLPTGRIVDVPADRDFRVLRPLGEVTLDAIYTDVQSEAGASECVYRDPRAGAEVIVRADAGFRELIVYAPPGRPTICLEPWTCAPDALNLQPRGLDAGLIVLPAGESWRGRIWIEVREVSAGAG